MITQTTRHIKSAHLFVSKGTRPRNKSEMYTALNAYMLKDSGCPSEILEECARDMAQLIEGENCILIPAPDHHGNTTQNLKLAHRIAENMEGGDAQVKDILTRSEPTESQCMRHRKGLEALTPEALKITIKPHKLFTLRRVYIVDNVTTSGATVQACADALGFGTGLVYAEAKRRR